MAPDMFQANRLKAWEDLAQSIGKDNPLPLSNSPAAKHMRCAAVLHLLAVALVKHVFRQTYLLSSSSSDNELNDLMDALSREDPAQAEYVRCVLVKSWPNAPEAHIGEIRTAVVKCVMGVAGSLLGEEKGEELRVRLGKLCGQMCRQWMILQKVQGRFEASMDASETGKWRLLSVPCPKKSQSKGGPVPSSATSNGRASGGGSGPNGQTSGSTKRSQNKSSESPAPSSAAPASSSAPENTFFTNTTSHSNDVQVTLWPVFIYKSLLDQALEDEHARSYIWGGLALSKAQVREAQSESDAHEQRRRVITQQAKDRSGMRQSIQSQNQSQSGSGSGGGGGNGEDSQQQKQGKTFLGSGAGDVLG
jgi:hypothetical protein